MLLEGVNVMIQVEQTLHCDLDLVVREVWERLPQQVGHKLLDVEDVVSCRGGAWAKRYADATHLHHREHIR